MSNGRSSTGNSCRTEYKGASIRVGIDGERNFAGILHCTGHRCGPNCTLARIDADSKVTFHTDEGDDYFEVVECLGTSRPRLPLDTDDIWLSTVCCSRSWVDRRLPGKSRSRDLGSRGGRPNARSWERVSRRVRGIDTETVGGSYNWAGSDPIHSYRIFTHHGRFRAMCPHGRLVIETVKRHRPQFS